MSNVETIYLNYYTLAHIEKEVTYSSSIREEECHGFHTFIDQDELSNEIKRVKIKVGSKNIDITNRLTKDEILLLDKIDSNDIELE
jgi:hypothetical protein